MLPRLAAVSWFAPGLAILLAQAAPAGERIEAPTAPPTAAASPAPDPASVVRYGPAYRYPQAGWVVLHIEGAPYDRGYQHGRLMAAELVEYIQTLAALRTPKAPADGWRDMRTLVNALFLRRYDAEYLEEMKGIADGAAAAGAKFDDRALDLIDVAAVNSDVEVAFLKPALEATATGLEGVQFREPLDSRGPDDPEDHCSAFVATGPATADGQIIFGHITMTSLGPARHYNVWLDVQPQAGHRVVMQTYPGGIQSGLDYHINSAGILLGETTIRQTGFNIDGTSLASRVRRAIQYADTIDKAVDILRSGNNGLYSNEWLLADLNTNEIAMFELGTKRDKLWRSSRREWPGGTEGFYWGCNNAKDLEVRKETLPSLRDKPGNVVFFPQDRDRAWLKLFSKYRGRITADFGFEAFTTPPLAAFPSCDAKFTTAAMARELKSWALFGPPLGRTWDPTVADRGRYAEIKPLVSNDWTLLSVDAVGPAAAETPLAADATPFTEEEKDPFDKPRALAAAWKGTLLPATDGDIWLAAGFANFERIVSLEKALIHQAKGGQLSRRAHDRLEVARFAPRSQWATAVTRLGRDLPLADVKADWETNDWYYLAAGKGVMLLAALRKDLGSEKFDKLMEQFGEHHGGQQVSSAQFRAAAEEIAGQSLESFFDSWLATASASAAAGSGDWSIDSFELEPESTRIVYGTLGDRAAQREAAELLARKIARRWSNTPVAISADNEVAPDQLRDRHLLLVGRPASNAITARMADVLPVRFGSTSLQLRGETYGNAGTAVIAAGANPLNPRYSVVVFAGLGADATWRSVQALPDQGSFAAPVMLIPAGHGPRRLCVDGAAAVAQAP